MSSERVTQEQAREALREVRDDDCRCHEAYKSRGMLDPHCNHDTAEYVAALERFIAQHPDPAATLYDWSDPAIPEWAEWIATDASGGCFAFEYEPVALPDHWWEESECGDIRRLQDRPDLASNWRNSLERRPKP
jgi:hypothetical protein